MLLNWYYERSMPAEEAIAISGTKFVNKYKAGDGLASFEKQDFVEALDMVCESNERIGPATT